MYYTKLTENVTEAKNALIGMGLKELLLFFVVSFKHECSEIELHARRHK